MKKINIILWVIVLLLIGNGAAGFMAYSAFMEGKDPLSSLPQVRASGVVELRGSESVVEESDFDTSGMNRELNERKVRFAEWNPWHIPMEQVRPAQGADTDEEGVTETMEFLAPLSLGDYTLRGVIDFNGEKLALIELFGEPSRYEVRVGDPLPEREEAVVLDIDERGVLVSQEGFEPTRLVLEAPELEAGGFFQEEEGNEEIRGEIQVGP